MSVPRHTVYVVGSGPAGVAAAFALVEQDVDVIMLDVGLELEPDHEQMIQQMYQGTPETWKPEHIKALKAGMHASAEGIPQKLTYGSDYPFRDGGQAAHVDRSGVDVHLSGARGGLSNAWGANVMPYANRDISDWCITSGDLAPHYAAIASIVPMSARHDDLDAEFPFYGKADTSLGPSRQAQWLMKNLGKNRDVLKASGIVAGYSRLAVQVAPTEANPRGCIYCGLCLYGCPYRLIYSSQTGVRELSRRDNFRYVPGVIVEKVLEEGPRVTVIGRSAGTAEPRVFTGERVYLACGAIATTRILLQSMDAFDAPVTLKDSAYFILPALQSQCAPDVTREKLHTLSQVFLEIADPALSERTIQLQAYTYSDVIEAAVRSRLGFIYPLGRPLWPSLYGRLFLWMGYLHSDDSPALEVTLRREQGESTLVIRPVPSARTRGIINGVARKLWRHRSHLRALPLKPLLHVAKPGKSYHYGGTLPMKTQPGRFESDTLGRPSGFRRVHAVDASVLPSIAATTIVFTAMANAHRIASAHKWTV